MIIYGFSSTFSYLIFHTYTSIHVLMHSHGEFGGAFDLLFFNFLFFSFAIPAPYAFA